MKSIKLLKFTVIVLAALQLIGTIVLATNIETVQAADNIQSLNFTAQVPITGSFLDGGAVPVGSYSDKTGKMTSDLLGKYIQAIYNYGLAVGGILATIVLMGGGLLWLTSGGESSKIEKAKDLIFGSITGLAILFCSWIILNTVNPDLLKLKSIEMQVIKRIDYCCDAAKGNVLSEKDGNCPTGSQKCVDNQTCINQGNNLNDSNSFACIDENKSFCCEFKSVGESKEKYCQTVSIGKTCKDATPPNSYFVYSKSYNSFCSTRRTVADTCYPEECVGEDDASRCNLDGYCYNEICWNGDGKNGEPCGNEKNSKCDPDTAQNGKTCEGDSWGRSCGSGLWCCKFNNDGTRINKN